MASDELANGINRLKPNKKSLKLTKCQFQGS
jgi:hypothetical protein